MLFRLTSGNKTVFGIMLITAAYVVVARLLGPLKMTWDLSIQLEAAYRFAAGLGLTNAFSSQFDVSQPPVSEYLTHFPPGLSLLVSFFLFFKIPLAIALKIIYATTTIVGWLGWAVVGSYCLSSPIKIGPKLLSGNLFIAAILPVFYTPSWTEQGTDIFLWAGIPIVVLLLLNSFRGLAWPIATALSGVIFSLLLTFRYASGFLLIAAFLIIVYAGFPKFQSIYRRFAVFGLASLVFTIPMMLYIRGVSATSVEEVASNDLFQTHGGRYLSSNPLELVFDSIAKIFSSLSNLFILTGITSRRLDFLDSYPSIWNDIFGLILFVFILLLSLRLVKNRADQIVIPEKEIPVSLSLSLSAFLLFSVAIVFIVSYSPFVIERYYLPVILCFILLMYRVSTAINFERFFSWLARGFIAIFILYNLFKPIYHSLFGDVSDLMSGVLALNRVSEIQYPSNEILFTHQESLNFLISTETQEASNAVFFLQSYPMYMSFWKFQDPLKFRRIPDEGFWENAYLSEPTKIFWVVNEDECPSICASSGNFNSDDPETSIQNLASLPNLKTVFTSPQEEVRVMVSDLPAGYHFVEKPLSRLLK